jgi:hypothetical protein
MADAWVYFDDGTALTLADYRHGKGDGKHVTYFIDADGKKQADVPDVKAAAKKSDKPEGEAA